MKVEFGATHYEAQIWHPERGKVGDLISFDTETTLIQDNRAIPDFILASVFNGEEVFFVTRDTLGAFMVVHGDIKFFMHNAPFDLEVVRHHTGMNLLPMVEASRVFDTGILDRLCTIAKTGHLGGHYSWRLAALSERLLDVVLEKRGEVRLTFGQYLRDGYVDYPAIPATYYRYAAKDAIATYLCGLRLRQEAEALTPQDARRFGLLTHRIQLLASLALAAVEREGMCVDTAHVGITRHNIEYAIQQNLKTLAQYGYIPGSKGVLKVYDAVVCKLEAEHRIHIPKTAKSGRKSQAADELEDYRHLPFIDAFLTHGELKKLLSTFLDKMTGVPILFPKFNIIVSTGRTSCREPNLQNLPRNGDIREGFIPPEGHLLLAADYGQLELCTLAQVAYSRFGHSVMRDTINAGEDLHRKTAAAVLNKSQGTITPDERQQAKAINFGLPGGLGAASLREYALASYGVTMTEEEAVHAKEVWLSLYPEMQQYMQQPDTLGEMTMRYALDDYEFTTRRRCGYPAAVFMRIMGGHSETGEGRPFTAEEHAWAWSVAERIDFHQKDRFLRNITAQHGCPELQRAVRPLEIATTLTGRVRANCSYCQARNTPFQGLAADGAKLALYGLYKHKYRVANFIHDEVLVYLPETADHKAEAEKIATIMKAAMRMVAPDVTVKVEYALMRRWYKGAKPVFDTEGRLIPWEPVKTPNPTTATPSR